MSWRRAAKTRRKLKIFIAGMTSTGKTYTALELMTRLLELEAEEAGSEAGRMFLLDTEYGAASDYATQFDFDHPLIMDTWEGDNLVRGFHPDRLRTVLGKAEQDGYPGGIIDSLTPFYNEPGGLLQIVDEAAKSNFSGWKEGTPIQGRMINAILRYPGHLICTLRMKDDYVVSANGQPRKVGLKYEQRAGLDYKFMFGFTMDESHVATVVKTRDEKRFPLGRQIPFPGAEVAEALWEWLREDVDEAAEAEAAKQREQQRKRARKAPAENDTDADDNPPADSSTPPAPPTPSAPSAPPAPASSWYVPPTGESVAERDERIAYAVLVGGTKPGAVAVDQHVSSAIVRKAVAKHKEAHDAGAAPWHAQTPAPAAQTSGHPDVPASTPPAASSPPSTPSGDDPLTSGLAEKYPTGEWDDAVRERYVQLRSDLDELYGQRDWSATIAKVIRDEYDVDDVRRVSGEQAAALVERLEKAKLAVQEALAARGG